jgi:polysaccharide chain length determinant protein (PEP-CTERM system associated)
MVRNGEISVRDVKRVLRKYWWIVPLSTLLCGSLGYVATRVLPAKYTSETKVLVEPPIVSEEYVKPVVSEDFNQRLTSLKANILSGPHLQAIIEKLNLYPELREKTAMSDLVATLKQAVDVELLPLTPGSWGRPPGFHMSVTFDQPKAAQQICNEITSMFMEQNAQRRMEQTQKTTQFVSKELQEAQTRLQEQDEKLAAFQRQYLGSLPDEVQSNLSLLNGLNTQLEATTQGLNRAQQDKAFNETVLSQQETNWKATLNGVQNPDTLEQQLAGLQEQLSQMLLRYTPDYPDVVKLKTQIAAVKSRMAAAETEAKAPTPSTSTKQHEPPQLLQLRTRVKQDDMTIAELTKRQIQIQDQIRVLQGRLQASPMVEQKFKDLTRDHQTALQIYNELLRKQSDSSIAKDLELERQSDVFRILDPPSLPLTPSFPKPLQFIGGGLGGGLALSVGLLYLLAMLDKAMYSERDVETCLKLPVLVSLPNLTADAVNAGGRVAHSSHAH